ncbi:putative U3 small nucleolar RNA-associated protein 7 [Rhodotorula kratochvilovae]
MSTSTTKRDKGKGRSPQEPSLLSNSAVSSLPDQDPSFVPPAHHLKKYLHGAKQHMLNKHSHPPKRTASSADKKLGHHLAHLSSTAQAAATHAFEHDDLLLPTDNAGAMQAETDLERTWRVTQRDILDSSALAAQGQQFSLDLPEFGPYAVDYTRNGRHLAIAGRLGHVGTFDALSSSLHSELHLRETVRDVKWLHDESFFAVAQKKYVYIYDKQGLEVHQLRAHIEVNRMEFLPFHFLLATIGNPGYLKYQDTSTGQLVAEHRTKLGAVDAMAQNPHTAMIHLGHANGTVTLWSPSVPHAQVKLLAHSSPVTSLTVDPSTMGHRMATTALDGSVKIWDTRMWRAVNEYGMKKTPRTSAWSQKGMLAVGWGNHVSVFNDLGRPSTSPRAPPPPYLTHTFPSTAVHRVAFSPFTDSLGVGHARGFHTLVVPGAGEANLDSRAANPFETKRGRREREVHGLLDKIPRELISLDPDALGRVDKAALRAVGDENPHKPGYKPAAFAKRTRAERLALMGRHAADEDESSASEDEEDDEGQKRREERARRREEKSDEKKRMRGRSGGIKKALRKRRRNVIDPQTVALKEKLERTRAAAQKAKAARLGAGTDAASGGGGGGGGGALDRFGAK